MLLKNDQAKLEVCSLSVSYADRCVLEDVNLKVCSGEFVALLGPSGCGKSTLLKSICGLAPVEEGDVLIDGRVVTTLPSHKRGVSMIFQDLRLFPHMSVRENVLFPLEMQHVARRQREKRVEEMLKAVQLIEFADCNVRTLSGGQRQRVALARAVVTQPEVLLLDEPFSALDESLRADMRSLVLRIHREFAMTTLFVTHDQREALEVSDKVAIIHNCGIEQFDTPEAIYRRPRTEAVACYFGDENRFGFEVRQGRARTSALSEIAPAEDGDYIAVVRAEAIKLDQAGKGFRVCSSKYHGSSRRVMLAAQDGLTLEAAVESTIELFEGDEVGVDISAEGVHFFNAEGLTV